MSESSLLGSSGGGMPAVLYQYCAPGSIEPILRGGKLWVSDSARMNDTTENVWIRDVLRRLFLAAGTPSYGVDVHDVLHEIDTHYELSKGPQVLIACFSKQGDLLSQWRAYAKDGTGVSIGFRTAHWHVPREHTLDDIFRFQGVSVALDRIVYDEAEQRVILRRVLDRLTELFAIAEASYNLRDAIRDTGIDALLYLARFMKHPGFSEEQEWRIACGASQAHVDTIRPLGFSDDVKVRPENIAYREFDFRSGRSDRPLAEIVLGPKCASSPSEVEALALSCGYSGVPARRSSVPYR